MREISKIFIIAQYFLIGSDKTGAAKHLGLMKEAKAQHEVLTSALSDPSVPLPAHHFETKEIKTEVAFANLAPHDMEVSVLQIKDLRPPTGYTTLNLYSSAIPSLIHILIHPTDISMLKFKSARTAMYKKYKHRLLIIP